MVNDPHVKPNSIPWPPLIYLAGTLAAVALHFVAPWRLLGGTGGQMPGLALVAGGVVLDLWAMFVMTRAHTNILPHRAAGCLVTWGPFAFTRNPIYLGNTIGLLGLGIAVSGWFLVSAAIAAAAVDRLAIRREEAHLHARFGDAWVAYARRVPRWIGPRGAD